MPIHEIRVCSHQATHMVGFYNNVAPLVLPQLINVALGEMSIVGPRPCLPYEFENYLAWQKERFNALPGITGLWQVNGKNKTTFAEMIRLDIRYARNQGLLQDVAILCKTFPVLVGQVRDMAVR